MIIWLISLPGNGQFFAFKWQDGEKDLSHCQGGDEFIDLPAKKID
jgi:hypothetical protein